MRYRIFALILAMAGAAMLSAAATPAHAGCGWSSCGGYQTGYSYQYAQPQYYYSQQPSYAQPCCNSGYRQQSCCQRSWYPQQTYYQPPVYQQPIYAAPQPYYAQPQAYAAAPSYEQTYAQPEFAQQGYEQPGYEQQAYVQPGGVAAETYAEPRAYSHRGAGYVRPGVRRSDHVYYPPGHQGRAIYRGPSKPRKKAALTPGNPSSVSARDVAPRRVLAQ